MAAVFGALPDAPVGTVFDNRRALYEAGVHRATEAGIGGGATEGADSIIVSGGYEDDKDYGDVVVYTGQGGRDRATGRQVADQTLTRGNAGLMKSKTEGLPIRVIRGAEVGSRFAPQSGFRYDGLYYVEDAHHRVGRSGFKVWLFTLRRDDPTPPPWAIGPRPGAPSAPLPGPSTEPPQKKSVTVMCVIRNTAMARRVKELHEHACQFCGIQIKTPTGLYAEGAHIKPLGAPHNGPDSPDNILCLCANHHLLFDVGGVVIADDLTLIGMPGKVQTVAPHKVNMEYVRYHRDHYAPSP